MLNVDIYKNFGHFVLDVQFSAGAGISALLGPSGNGKSLVLNTIAGFIKPEEGYITFGDKVFWDSAQNINMRPEERNVGYILQDSCLFPHLSVRSNLLYGRKKECRYSLVDVVDLLEIGHLLDRNPRRLSGGEKQRVNIGRALLSNPGLLLMDEPVSSLEEESCWKILSFIKKVHKTFAMPILFVSHSREEVEFLADQTASIEQGRIVDIRKKPVRLK